MKENSNSQMLQIHFWWLKVIQYPNISRPCSHQYYYLPRVPASGVKESLLSNKPSWLLVSDGKANKCQLEFPKNTPITKYHERIVAADFISVLHQTTAPRAPPQKNHFLCHTGHPPRQSVHYYTLMSCEHVSPLLLNPKMVKISPDSLIQNKIKRRD